MTAMGRVNKDGARTNLPPLVARPRPCSSCPYRLDAPVGLWAEQEYLKLREYDSVIWGQPQGVFMCHQQVKDAETVKAVSAATEICRGWTDTHGAFELLAIRLAAGTKQISLTEFQKLEEPSGVPVFESGEAAAAHGLSEMEYVDERTHKMMKKILNKRGGRG